MGTKQIGWLFLLTFLNTITCFQNRQKSAIKEHWPIQQFQDMLDGDSLVDFLLEDVLDLKTFNDREESLPRVRVFQSYHQTTSLPAPVVYQLRAKTFPRLIRQDGTHHRYQTKLSFQPGYYSYLFLLHPF